MNLNLNMNLSYQLKEREMLLGRGVRGVEVINVHAPTVLGTRVCKDLQDKSYEKRK